MDMALHQRLEGLSGPQQRNKHWNAGGLPSSFRMKPGTDAITLPAVALGLWKLPDLQASPGATQFSRVNTED